MKKTYLWMAAVAFALSACGGKEAQQTEEGETIVAQPREPRCIAMEAYEVTNEVEGTSLSYTLSCKADDTLPMVCNEERGDTYVDNRYELVVMRSGTPYYNKTLTKADFLSRLDAGIRDNTIFDAFIFDHVADGKLYFILSFSDAVTTECLQSFMLCVAPDGSSAVETYDPVLFDDFDEE